MRRLARTWFAAALTLMLMGAVGCASTTATDTDAAATCAKNKLPLYHQGVLTIATDDPAFEPWYKNDNPGDGQGFESAVAYAIAEDLGFRRDEVKWTKVHFADALKGGQKKFDFDINQVSITADRAKIVTFSDGYYTVNQAVIALKTSPIANAQTVADLRHARLGSQTGTTSFAFIKDVVKPLVPPIPFAQTEQAKPALVNGQIDGMVVDLPTAFFLTAVEIPDATIIGQFEPQGGSTEQYGMVFQKNNPLVNCVNQALTELRNTGELQRVEDTWLAESAGARRFG